MLYMAVGSTVLITVLVLLIAAVVQIKRKNTKRKENLALRGIEAGMSEQLHTACPGSKWRWVCKPVRFAANGGIARVDVLDPYGKQWFMDVCLSASGYMALHVANVAELTASGITAFSPEQASPANAANVPIPAAPQTGVKPNDKESVAKWYNIILFDALNNLIGDLNAKGDVCLHIGHDGKAFIEDGGSKTVVYDFGEMPDVALWSYIIERLGDEGLFAEIQEEDCIFISWA